MTIEYRHPTEADIEAMVDVFNRSSREIPLHRDETVEEFRRWSFEEEDWMTEGHLLAIVDGDIVGYGGTMVQKSRQESGMNDAFIGFSVVPEHRGKGIEQHMMKFSLDYLRGKVKYAKRFCMTTEGWRNELCEEFGMKDIRHGYTMIYDRDEPPSAVSLPEGIWLRCKAFGDLNDEELKDFVDAFNDSFSEHFNFSPAPVERFIKYRDTEEEPGYTIYAYSGDDIVGVCLCEESTAYNRENGTNVGWANILGVKKSHRSRGLGRALLSCGMLWIWSRGMDTIYLGMDAENSKALDLYTSLGFRVNTESITYQLELE